jgi:hypothetical protein
MDENTRRFVTLVKNAIQFGPASVPAQSLYVWYFTDRLTWDEFWELINNRYSKKLEHAFRRLGASSLRAFWTGHHQHTWREYGP